MSRMSDFNGCRVPDPPEYEECLGYWDNPDRFSEYACKTCANYDECLKASEEISDHNMKMWEEIFKAEREDKG